MKKKLNAFINELAQVAERMAIAGLAMLILVGCVAQETSVTVYSDGSGIITVREGISERALQDMDMTKDDMSNLIPLETYYIGEEMYYGITLSKNFARPEDLNFKFEVENVSAETGESIKEVHELNFGEITLRKTNSGFDLDIFATAEIPDDQKSSVEQNTAADEKLQDKSTAEFSRLFTEILKQGQENAICTLSFQMPGFIKQTSGRGDGVQIAEKVLTIDYADLYRKMIARGETKCELSFSISAANHAEKPVMPITPTFRDVPCASWYYEPVEISAARGLISGYEDGTFRPFESITVAEFCQILAKANRLETGAGKDGWWAGKAVESCVDAGYIKYRGAFDEAHYGQAITREEAVATLQQVSKLPNQYEFDLYVLWYIPDGEEIDPEYRDLILAAYNSGLTHGCDNKLTFHPKDGLSRAQLCQLLLTIGWRV